MLEPRRLFAVWTVDLHARANDFVDLDDQEWHYKVDEDGAAGGSVSAGDGGSASASGGASGASGSVSGSASTPGGAEASSAGTVSSYEASMVGAMQASFSVSLEATRAASGSAGADMTETSGSAFALLGAGPAGVGSLASAQAFGPDANTYANTMVFQAGSRGDASYAVTPNGMTLDAFGNGDFQATARAAAPTPHTVPSVWASATNGSAESHGTYTDATGAATFTGLADVDSGNAGAGFPYWNIKGSVPGTNFTSTSSYLVEGAAGFVGAANADVKSGGQDTHAKVGGSATNLTSDSAANATSAAGTVIGSNLSFGFSGWSHLDNPLLPDMQTGSGEASAQTGTTNTTVDGQFTAENGGRTVPSATSFGKGEGDNLSIASGEATAVTDSTDGTIATGAFSTDVQDQKTSVKFSGEATKSTAGGLGETSVTSSGQGIYEAGLVQAHSADWSARAKVGAGPTEPDLPATAGKAKGQVKADANMTSQSGSTVVSGEASGHAEATYSGSADREYDVRGFSTSGSFATSGIATATEGKAEAVVAPLFIESKSYTSANGPGNDGSATTETVSWQNGSVAAAPGPNKVVVPVPKLELFLTGGDTGARAYASITIGEVDPERPQHDHPIGRWFVETRMTVNGPKISDTMNCHADDFRHPEPTSTKYVLVNPQVNIPLDRPVPQHVRITVHTWAVAAGTGGAGPNTATAYVRVSSNVAQA